MIWKIIALTEKKTHMTPVKFFLWLIFLIFLTEAPVSGVNPVEQPLKGQIERGIELTLQNDFDGAGQIYREMIRENPREAVGYFYEGATLQARMLDAEDYGEKDRFYELMDKTIRLSDSLSKVRPEDGWLYFYKGSAYLYQSFLKMKDDQWYPAYRDASRGVKNLEKALEIDSTLYDAYMGIGGYKYWKSAKSNFLNWLPFISDEREEAIRMINIAIEKGEFVGFVGKDQLVYILIDFGQTEKALEIARENHLTYPRSRFLKWSYASVSFRAGEWDLSRKLFGELLEEIRQLPSHNHFNEVDCLVKLAEIAEQDEGWEEAHRLSDEALRLPLETDVRKRARNKLKRALEIRERAGEQVLQSGVNP